MGHLPQLSYVTDPATGRRYPLPAGGAGDDGGQGGETPPEGEGEGEQQGGAEGEGEQQGEGEGEADGFRSPESKRAVLADLTSERERRRQAEAELQRFRDAETAREREQMDEAERARAEGRDEGVTIGQQMLRRAAVLVAASDPAHPFYDPAEAATLLGDRLSEVPIGDDGTVDDTRVRELVAELADQRPHLIRKPADRQPAPADLNGGGGPGGVTPPGEPRDADEWNAQLRREFSRG